MRKSLKKSLSIITLSICASTYAYAGSSSGLTICPAKSGVPASANFVYCGPAVCKPDPNDPSKANCNDCYILKGENAGTTTCAERAPQLKDNIWTSSFTLRKDLDPTKGQQPVIFCDTSKGADTHYADCLNAKCQVTDKAKGLASCSCQVVDASSKAKTYATQARSCAAKNKCNAPKGYILNGAPTVAVSPLIALIAKKTNASVESLTCS